MEFTLGIFHEGSKMFKEVRKLSAREYADYKEAASMLLRLLDDRDRFQDVLSAFVTYMDVVTHHEDLLRDHRDFDGALLKRELNSRLSNYLRATRSFVDHSDKVLSDRYGKKSPQRSAFIAATHEVYDGRFSYRLLEQVRNYTQHAGEAIGHISFGWRTLDPARATRSASESAASPTHHTPSSNRSARPEATASARRVLPLPPAPVSVTSRASVPRRLRRSWISPSRPTKLVNCNGSLVCGGGLEPRSAGNSMSRPRSASDTSRDGRVESGMSRSCSQSILFSGIIYTPRRSRGPEFRACRWPGYLARSL